MKGDDLYKEREHIKFWDNCLNDLKKQFEIMSKYLEIIRTIKIRRMNELGNILSSFKTEIIPYKTEPSHLYSLCEIFFEFVSFLWEVINKSNDELYLKINSMNVEIMKDLDQKKINLYKDNISLIDQCQTLINEIKEQENEFNKKKVIMNEAQINRDKIKSQKENIYKVSEIKKADLLLAKSIKKMDEVLIPMDKNKIKLKEFKTTLIATFSHVFENYFSLHFKHLAILYQYFYLLENNKLNILTNMQKKIKGTLFQLSNLNFELNDYIEKKFGEMLDINYDGIILFDFDELLNKANYKLLLKISKNLVNYVKVFMICLKYRKKIMKHFCQTLKLIYKLELNIQTENEISYNDILDQIKSVKYTSEGTSKRWNYLLLNLKSEEDNNNYKLIISWIEEYINFVSHEYNEFDLNWREYQDKINEKLKSKNDINNINNMNGNDNFREIIKNSIKFIKNNINNIRTKDKAKMQNLHSSFERVIIKYKNLVNKYIDLTEVQISSLATLDIYEESKVTIIKYFNNVKIRNYIGFLEKMKHKLISQFQSEDSNEKETDQSKENENILPEESSLNVFEESQSQISQDNINNESEIKNLNIVFKDSRKFLFENNNKNKNIISSIINKDNNNLNNNTIKENDSIEENIKNNDNITLDLLNRNRFTELTKIENPYKNIEEEELIKLKEISTKKDDDELDQGENIIDNFNCALKDKILLQGKFIITNKRIWFRSYFNTVTLFGKTTIMIPLNDIISIEKKYYLALDNSIEVKTEKVSYFFTNYLSRDNCFDLLQQQLNILDQVKSYKSLTKRKISDKKNTKDKSQLNNQKKIFNKNFANFLKNFDFNEKLKQITEERYNLFIKKYRNKNKLTFLSEKNFFSQKFFEHEFNSCPLYICFKYICKASTQLDELGFSKGFFESIIIQNISKDVIIIEKEGDENDIESWKIPDYFINEEYVLDLFGTYDGGKFEEILNEINMWINKYEYNCYGINKKIKKNSKGDLYIAYFVSPTLLIFDIILHSANDNFLTNFIPVFRYKFESNIEFNEKKGKFDISTKLTVLFDIFFEINSTLSNEERNKVFIDYKNTFKNFILGKLIDVINNYCGKFKDLYEKTSEENIYKKLNDENIIYLNEFDINDNDNNINNDDMSGFEELQKNNNLDDIKTVKSIEINNINITQENNFINNINVINNENIKNINNEQNEQPIEKKDLNVKETNSLEKDKEKKDTNLIKNIKSKIKVKEINVILVIIIVLILMIFLLSFLKKGKILINIINLICLGLAIFLLIKERLK